MLSMPYLMRKNVIHELLEYTFMGLYFNEIYSSETGSNV